MENDSRRIREVWETTQENLETAVGSAYSGWNSFYLRHFEPCLKSVTLCFTSCCYDNRSHRANIRHDSLDIFFDMYDDDEAVGRDELERLLSAGVDEEEQQQQDGVYGSSIDVVQPTYEQARKPSVPDVITRMFSGRPRSGSHQQQPLQQSGVRRYLTSLFPSLARYRPSTNDLQTRARSNTKSSTQSSETYRSRRDLFSDDEIPDDDAQMMSDNFAQDLEFRSSSAPSSVNDQSIDELVVVGEHMGLTDKQLREEELRVEMEEETEAARLAALSTGNEATTSNDYNHTNKELDSQDDYDEDNAEP